MRCASPRWALRLPLRHRASTCTFKFEHQLISSTPRQALSHHEHQRQHQRGFALSTLTAILTPPAVFTGLVISLWTYKCMMMVVFQNKIIYMPGIPPFARSEKVADYEAQCRPVFWQEHPLTAVDGMKVKLLKGLIPTSGQEKIEGKRKRVVVLYFQGNASSLPPRLPYLSVVLKALRSTHSAKSDAAVEYSILALSYRGFWTSKGRASQAGIELDAQAALDWAFANYDLNNTQIVLWGQSIGAGVATTALASLVENGTDGRKATSVRGTILETPFLDLKSMLVALYPQKFLPYRYLTPFLKDSWDSQTALGRIARSGNAKGMRTLILQAGSDEIVPVDHAGLLEDVCRSGGLQVEKRVIGGALHTEVLAKSEGRVAITRFLREFA